jgi:hypothetical protein
LNQKKLFAFTLVIALAIPISPAIATAKAGAVCKKAGIKSVVAGKTFTCMKSGKKLIWNKGTKVITQPIVVPDTWPIDQSADKNIFLIADKSVRKTQSISRNAPLIEINYGPTTDKVRTDEYLNSMMVAAKFWSIDWKYEDKITVAVGTAKDFTWISQYWQRFGLTGGGFDNSESSYTAFGEYCSQGSAIYGNNQPFFWGCISTKGSFEIIGLRKFAAHEYTHLAQYGIMSNQGARSMPGLLMEGSADFYGVSLGSNPDKINQDWKSYFEMGYVSDSARTFLKNATEEQIAELLIDSFNRSTRLDNHWYYTGAYVTLRMIAAKGHQGFVEFMREVASSGNVQSTFEKIYGIKFENFAKLIAPEIQKLSSTIKYY